MLVSLKAWILKTFTKLGIACRSRRRTKPIRKRHLAFEGLERKQLLAADVWVSGGGTFAEDFTEENGPLTLQVSASEVSNSFDVTVSVVENGATAGDDFTIANPGTITFTPSGPSTYEIDVQILDDFFANEGTESFDVVLSVEESADVEFNLAAIKPW